MQIPLVLRRRRDGRLSFAMPPWYRAIMGGVALFAGLSLFAAGEPPGLVGWIVAAVIGVAALFEDSWVFDAERRSMTQRSGLVFLARRTELAFAEVEGFRVEPFVRGTLPGSADEAAQNAAALAGEPLDEGGRRRSSLKRPLLCLVVETRSGERYFVEAVPARLGGGLKEKAARIAEFCGLPLATGTREGPQAGKADSPA